MDCFLGNNSWMNRKLLKNSKGRYFTSFFLILTIFYGGCNNSISRQSSCSPAPVATPKIEQKGPTSPPTPITTDYQIGVFYFPGWQTGTIFWKDLLGTTDSHSPCQSWPERIPLLGLYPEEETWVADWHIKWAVEHGISFFAYDWFWQNNKPHLDHAIQAHLQSPYKDLLKFCVMWANHDPFIPTMADLPNIANYWISNYFNQSNYLKFNDRPVVMVFLSDRIGGDPNNTSAAISTIRTLVKNAGYPDILLIAISNDTPDPNLVNFFKSSGYNAYTPYNYVKPDPQIASYDSMIDQYKTNWATALSIGGLPYIVPVTPGWDARPAQGSGAAVRTGSTPDKFKVMLQSAKEFIDRSGGDIASKMLMIEAWNELGEGAYIEPTKQWEFGSLDALREVFIAAPQLHTDEYPVVIK